MNNNQDKNTEEKFETELHASLKIYGYLFPENEKDVIAFENLYGKTEIETPSIEKLFSENSIPLDSGTIDLNIRLAAFTPTENQIPDFFKDESDDTINNNEDKNK